MSNTITDEMHAALCRPFPISSVEWKILSVRFDQTGDGKKTISGQCAAYVDARDIMDRFDLIFGPSGWSTEMEPVTAGRESGIKCNIVAGGVSHSDMADLSEPNKGNSDHLMKGAATLAFKRAAVHFGVARYLYDLDRGYFKESPNGTMNGEIKEDGTGGKYVRFKWNPPTLPPWAIPDAVDVRVVDQTVGGYGTSKFVSVPLDFVTKAKAMAPDKCKEQYLKIVAKLPEGFSSLPWSDRLDPMGKVKRLIDLRARIVLWEDENNRTLEL